MNTVIIQPSKRVDKKFDAIINGTKNVEIPNSINITIGGLNYNGTVVDITNKTSSFSSIGDGLTDTEAANFYTAVQAFQTTLGRQV